MKKLIAILLSVFLFSSCAGGGAESESKLGAEDGKTLYLTGYNFESANPLDVKNTVNRDIFSLVYKSLYKTDAEGRPIPVLSESISCSLDNLSWEIVLKNNISFHNGEPLCAKDVEKTINYLIENETIYKNNVRNISSVRATSAYVAIITLTAPAVNFPAQLTFPIISSQGFGDSGFNGTGDFKVTDYVKMKKMVLEAKEGAVYDKNSVSRIEVQLVSDKETASYANQSGVSDLYLSEELLSTSTDLSKSGIKSKDYISGTFGFLLLNNKKLMFKDVNVRKAINLAIDKNGIVDNILFSKAVPTNTPIRPGYYLSVAEKEIKREAEQAKKLLADNGYTADVTTGVYEKEITYVPEREDVQSEEGESVADGEESPITSEKETVTENVKLSFEILVNYENTFRMQIATVIAENLKFAGIEAKVNAVSFEEYEKAYEEGAYDAILCSMILGEDNDLSAFAKKDGIIRFSDSEGDKIINDISLTVDEDKKREYYHSLYDFFENKVPLVSLYFEKNSLQYSNRITKGLNPTPYCVFNDIEEWRIK